MIEDRLFAIFVVGSLGSGHNKSFIRSGNLSPTRPLRGGVKVLEYQTAL